MSKTIHGIGREYDISLLAGPQLKTTTSQYKVVGIPDTSTAANRTAYLANNATANENTATAYFAIGINQSYLSANSSECQTRLFGISKAYCAQSIMVGQPVMAYYGASTTTFPGFIQQVPYAASVGVATASISSYVRVLGFALESGSTNSVITIMISPSIMPRQTIME